MTASPKTKRALEQEVLVTWRRYGDRGEPPLRPAPRLLTSLGFSWSSLSLCPRRPYRPLPHVYKPPAAVTQALWAPPAATSTTSMPLRDSMTRGRSHGLQKGHQIQVTYSLIPGR